MILILCLDNQNGMCFGGKRQSSDQMVLKKIAEITFGQTLWVTPYTKTLFEVSGMLAYVPQLRVSNNPQLSAQGEEGSFCFVENQPIQDGINQMLLFFWNTTYPATMHFEICPCDWSCIAREIITGSSHKRIDMLCLERRCVQ